MSQLIVPDASKKFMAHVIIQDDHPDAIKLFKSNTTPTHATILADLTEADFGGYAAASLDSPVVGSVLDASSRAVITWNDVTFTRTGTPTNTIYGYWVNNANGDLLWVERFDNPIVLDTNGLFIKLTPKLTDMSQFLNT